MFNTISSKLEQGTYQPNKLKPSRSIDTTYHVTSIIDLVATKILMNKMQMFDCASRSISDSQQIERIGPTGVRLQLRKFHATRADTTSEFNSPLQVKIREKSET